MCNWCKDVKKFDDLVITVQLAYEIRVGLHNWGAKWRKTPNECLEYLNKAENLLTISDATVLPIRVIYKIRDFYELKSKILILLNQPLLANKSLTKALYISSWPKIEARISRLFWITALIVVCWYWILLPIVKKIF